MIILCFYFYINNSKSQKVFYGGLILLFTAVLYLTGSRGAALGLEFGLLTYGYLSKNKKDMFFIACIFILVMVLMFIPSHLLPWNYNINSPLKHGVDSSVNNRSTIWISCLNMFKQKPITGWGLLGILFAKSDIFVYHTREPHAHNIWISIITTLGIVGLGIYIYMKIYLYEGIKILYINGCKLAPLFASLQVLVIGHGLVDFTIMTPQGGIIFFGCSALISSLAVKYSASREGILTYSSFLLKKKTVKSNS
jgi:O-antigen ligase